MNPINIKINQDRMKYFIITPTKNEEQNILSLISLIEEQTIKPVLWVMVDESSDNTKNIVKKLAEKYDWVKSIDLEQGGGYLGVNYGVACKTAFDYGIKYCKDNSIVYNYIGLIDADVVMGNDFFETLMIQFEKEPDLGIASGSEFWNISEKLVSAGTREDLPMGPARLWRKKCFEESSGYMATASPDSVSNTLAKLKGWKTKQIKDLEVITRRTSSAKGYWWGAIREGKNYYFLNFHPIIIILKSLKYSLKKPYYIGLGLFIGYFGCLIKKEKQIENEEIKYYYRNLRLKELFQYYFNMLKKREG
jgi:glycosyltransferase involved in cell wall biosynthesis